jgi:hypothetical protein
MTASSFGIRYSRDMDGNSVQVEPLALGASPVTARR